MDKCKCGHEKKEHWFGENDCLTSDCDCIRFAPDKSDSAKWKAKADKLARALEAFSLQKSSYCVCSVHDGTMPDAVHSQFCRDARAALAEYKKE